MYNDQKSPAIKKNNWIQISKADIVKLLKYYIFLFIVSSTCLITELLLYNSKLSSLNYLPAIVLFSFPASLLGSSIYYIRKLYKSCIQEIIEEPSETFSSGIRTLGAKIYFYSRPLISVPLSIITVLGIYIGINVLTINPDIVDNNFNILCVLVSFYTGFSNGLVLKNMDGGDNGILKKLLGGNNYAKEE